MGIDCSRIRDDIPELQNSNVVFLDNAASTLKPRQVIEAMSEFAYTTYANVHRGVYKLSMEASKIYEDAHETVAKFIGGDMREVVFVKNTSEAIQLIALTLYWNGYIGEGDEIIITEAEHHSNMLPWVRIARKAKAKVRLLPVDRRGIPRWEDINEYLSERTRVIATNHISNVTGYISPLQEIGKIAEEHDSFFVVDAAQSVPHLPVDFKKLKASFAAFSGHKMLGPTGIGVMWGRHDLLEDMEPPLGAGGTVKRVKLVDGLVSIDWEDSPWKYESGTPPIIEAVGLAKAVEYLSRIGMENVYEYERSLTRDLLEAVSALDFIRIVGPNSSDLRHGIVSFNVEGLPPDVAGLSLSRQGIAVRTGLHCAHILHDKLGFPDGSVRASLYIYNCREDITRLVEALESIYAKHVRGLR
ncbi:MAG: cysteine desulfurase [Desulfurococcales archaeon]|nr:cysteine desulfurase [Desulfurococcales archaeon]